MTKVWILWEGNNRQGIVGVFSSEMIARAFCFIHYAQDIEEGMRTFSESQDFQTGYFWKTNDTTEIFLEHRDIQGIEYVLQYGLNEQVIEVMES